MRSLTIRQYGDRVEHHFGPSAVTEIVHALSMRVRWYESRRYDVPADLESTFLRMCELAGVDPEEHRR